jgi:hypothetical protein
MHQKTLFSYHESTVHVIELLGIISILPTLWYQNRDRHLLGRWISLRKPHSTALHLGAWSGGWNMRTASWSGIPSDQYVDLQTATTKREQPTIEHFISIQTWEEEAQKPKNPLSFNKTLVILQQNPCPSFYSDKSWLMPELTCILPLVFSVAHLRNAELDQRILFRSSVSLMASDEVADTTWSGIHYLSDF